MRKISLLLSTLILAAMVLAACGGGATSTNVAGSPPPVTADATDDMVATATESPTEEATAEGTATEPGGVPVTGDVNPARISNQLDFTVWSQDGEQIGEVDDMVLNMDDPRVAYVIVGTGGFLDLGERDVLVPWESLELQTGTGDTTGGQQNAFVLQADLDTFRNAPDFDLGTLPEMGQPAADWDVDIRGYWESGGTAAVNTPAAGDATATTDPAAGQATATTDAAAGQATATTDAGTGTGTGGPAADLQGVMLASDVLGSTITVTGQGNNEGQAESQATATPGTGTGAATATPGVATEPGTEGLGNMDVTVDDLIVAVDTGDILYIVVNALFDEGERWIPVPLDRVQWNADTQVFVLNANPTNLRDAPFFENEQFPDTTTDGWNSEFDTFWQNVTNP
ncbi:MAG TPA: PRC-barrel domain-containing protein [Anaerolineales bacterium]|nr:PRC-barrel domain-containing protein [Anaerolineales bacterium]